MIRSIIVAIAENYVIGKDNQLLWKLSDDLKMFKKITSGHHILMGRKTFESIGKALPNRINLVVSSKPETLPIDVIGVKSIEEGISFAKEANEQEVFIIGGGKIYEQCLPFADRIYLTQVAVNIQGDTKFPEIMYDHWEILEKRHFFADEKNEYSFDFTILERKN